MAYYTPEQIAEKLQLSVRTIWAYIRDGKLPATKLGRKYRISDEQLERFMRSQELKPVQENED